MKAFIKDCPGCNIYYGCKCTDEADKCPCIKCLVKMVCNTGCTEYDSFEYEIRKQKILKHEISVQFQGKVMAR